ncbi:hypothetical protein WMY93_030809 [Mugilogobius chulae]|uniref:Centrosome and spindle pole-associated protein 1 C-terminal domain-containing protein n=1 Tax=Mugilogobius chulae TaxID=88201 RepID=A0AAW0MQR7_9GOBI
MPPPASSLRAAHYHNGTGLHFLLGAEYERKKQALQEELQMDYKRFINQNKDLKFGVYDKSEVHGLSLPIDERTSEKEKLKEERKREYNLFLQDQAKTKKRGPLSVKKPDEPSDFDTVHKCKDYSLPKSSWNAELSTPQKDAATLTDIRKSRKGRKTWDFKHQRQRALLSRQEHSDSSVEIFSNDSDEDFRHRRKRNGQIHKSKYIKDVKDQKANRAPHKQSKETVSERPISTTAETAMTFATGLLIGHTEERDTLLKKKEQYKQALLSQIAEQRENKRKEKFLGLQVVATGAAEPHILGSEYHTNQRWKQNVFHKPETGIVTAKDNPEIKHFPDSNIRMDHREPHNTDSSSPKRDSNSTLKSGANHKNYSPDTSVEEYNKNFSLMIGDVSSKMVSAVPPPLPPRVEHNYKTPHDEAYHYYGSRHPLEMILPYNQSDIKDKPGESQEFERSCLSQQRRTKHQSRQPTQPDFGQKITVIPLRDPSTKSDRQRRENYLEALKQQVRDKAERQRKEKEELELYDAKKVSEMMTYNPWGRAGGGAPLKDQSGNLITDLDQMHRLNEENYRKCSLNSFGLITGASQAKYLPPPPGLEPFGYKERELLQRQDDYKELLNSKQKQAEERERQKDIEEREEKRLVEERARLQKEYEEEAQRNKMKMQRKIDYEHSALEGKEPPTQVRTRQEQREPHVTSRGYNEPRQNDYIEFLRQQVEEKRQRQEKEREQQKIIEEKEEKRLAQQRAQTLKEYEEEEQRNKRKLQKKQDNNIKESKPSRPKFEHKPTNTIVSSPSSVTSQLTPKTDHLESSQKHDGQVLVKTQHLQDTSSREELLHNYPDPPTDGQSLDIQQQALLREQRRTLERMTKTRDMRRHYMDAYDWEEDFYHRSPPGSKQSSSRHRRQDNDEDKGEKMGDYEPDAQSHSSNPGCRRKNPPVKRVMVMIKTSYLRAPPPVLPGRGLYPWDCCHGALATNKHIRTRAPRLQKIRQEAECTPLTQFQHFNTRYTALFIQQFFAET